MISDKVLFTLLVKTIELFTQEVKALEAAGLDVGFMLTTMKNLLEQSAATEAQQETMKRQSKLTTDSWLALKRKAYVTTSGYLDMAIAAVKKDSTIAKNFRQIRSKLHRPRKDEAPIATPVTT